MAEAPTPRSLVWATDLDVLAPDRVLERRDGYTVVRSPGNPTFYWGNFLLFDREPGPGDGDLWEALFEAEFGADPRVLHRSFGWDRADGTPGAAREELGARGYDIDELVGLVTERPVPHPRANADVEVRALDPRADEELWNAVVEVHVETRGEGHAEEGHRDFIRRWFSARRPLFEAGRGAWYVAVDPVTGAVAGSCGVIATSGRGRFQMVATAPAFHRRGICSRIVVEAADHAARAYGAERFVIVADTGYHALGLYESLGFERREHVFSACWWPRTS